MLKTIRHFLELIRFSHTLFALPFALLAAVMAWAMSPFSLGSSYNDILAGRDYWIPTERLPGFRLYHFVGLIVCMVFARSFAMAWNRLADRRLDANNPRTAGRHLPAGKVSVAQVAAFAFVCAAGFIASTEMLLMPYVRVAPCAESERNRYWGLSRT